MAAPPARARADYDYLIKLLLIGDSGKIRLSPQMIKLFLDQSYTRLFWIYLVDQDFGFTVFLLNELVNIDDQFQCIVGCELLIIEFLN